MWEGMEEEGGRRKGVVALGTDTQRTNTETENELLNVRTYVHIQHSTEQNKGRANDTCTCMHANQCLP